MGRDVAEHAVVVRTGCHRLGPPTPFAVVGGSRLGRRARCGKQPGAPRAAHADDGLTRGRRRAGTEGFDGLSHLGRTGDTASVDTLTLRRGGDGRSP